MTLTAVDAMEAALEFLGPALALSTLAVAGLIVLLARRSLAAAFLATYLAGWGASGMSVALLEPLGVDLATRLKVVWAFQCLIAAAIVAFAIVFPNVGVTRGRRIALTATAAAAIAGIITIFLLPDGGFHDPETGARTLFPVLGSLTGAANGIAIALLGRRWLNSPAGTYRTQLVWGILPIAWWTLHDGLGYGVYPMILQGGVDAAETHPIVLVAGWFNLAAIVFTLSLMSVAVARAMRGRGANDDRALGFVLLYALPLTLLQVVAPDTGGGISTHILLDYAIVPLAVYGVLRHRVVDIDLKLKRGLQHSTVAATFLGVFFVVATIAQEFLADTLGWLAGGAAAGVLVLGIAPLQRVAERLSSAALPHARNDAGYLTYRRYQIYRVALEGTLRDGVIDPAETSALRSLREELGLTLDDHHALESDARTRMRAASA